MNKQIEAPAVVQGCTSKSQETQGRCMREAADAFKRKAAGLQPGKGDTRRHRRITSDEFEENWDMIDWKRKKKL